MTCRELIVYILSNHLEDEEVFKNGKLIGFMTSEEAAVKLDVGKGTVEALQSFGLLHGILIGNKTYIPANEVERLI